jgi:hypothetical protein
MLPCKSSLLRAALGTITNKLRETSPVLMTVIPCEIAGRTKALLIQNSSHRSFGKTGRGQVTYPKRILNVTEYTHIYFYLFIFRSLYSLSTTFFLQAKLDRCFQNVSNPWVTNFKILRTPPHVLIFVISGYVT